MLTILRPDLPNFSPTEGTAPTVSADLAPRSSLSIVPICGTRALEEHQQAFLLLVWVTILSHCKKTHIGASDAKQPQVIKLFAIFQKFFFNYS